MVISRIQALWNRAILIAEQSEDEAIDVLYELLLKDISFAGWTIDSGPTFDDYSFLPEPVIFEMESPDGFPYFLSLSHNGVMQIWDEQGGLFE